MGECILARRGGADVSVVNATENDVVSPKVIVGSDGNPIGGILPDYKGIDTAAKSFYLPPSVGKRLYFELNKGRYELSNGSGWVYADDNNLTPENIKPNTSIFGMVGAMPEIHDDVSGQLKAKQIAVGNYTPTEGENLYLYNDDLLGKYNNSVDYLRYGVNEVLNAIGATKYATFTATYTQSGQGDIYYYYGGSQFPNSNVPYCTITGLSFKPKIVLFKLNNTVIGILYEGGLITFTGQVLYYPTQTYCKINNDGFTVPLTGLLTWEAFK